MDFYGYTALHAAAENGRLEMIQPLLGEIMMIMMMMMMMMMMIMMIQPLLGERWQALSVF